MIAARAALASVCLGTLPSADLGGVRLRDDQRRIVARARRAIALHGGCLVAEDVGRGKTFVALALARDARDTLVVAPASLASTWRAAAERAGVSISLVSHESLSRRRTPATAYDMLIVDESHHFRTMSTRRHRALALLAARAPVVLLSATPLQNRVRDLAAQLALFLGERALEFDAKSLSRFIVRGSATTPDDMPVVRPPEWIQVNADDTATLRSILALPPPARPLDGGDAGALRTIGLVRAWASSRAALQATLRSRERLATAIRQGVEDGRVPTRREARAWHAAEGVVQLGFSSMLIAASPSAVALTELGAALAHDGEAMDTLRRVLRASPDPDAARVAALRDVRARHPERRIIAFSEYASTISALYVALRTDAAVGMLTAREARIATGRIARDELLARFAPGAQGAHAHGAHQSVTLLLATDLLSEGVNLQDASVVVHLDLPWNPARLAQRVGRVRRIGGATEVWTYVFAPPASAESLLYADARLRRKLASAERVVGTGFSVLPALSRVIALATAEDLQRHAIPNASASATAEGDLIARLARWLHGAGGVEGVGRDSAPAAVTLADTHFAMPVAAAVVGVVAGWLAALSDGRLLASCDGRAPDEMSSVVRVAAQAEGAARDVGRAEVSSAISAIAAWLRAESIAAACGIDDAAGPLRRTIERWIGTMPAMVPRHQRAVALSLVGRISAALESSLPLGAERLLAAEALRGVRLDALHRAASIADDVCALRRADVRSSEGPRVMALIVVGPVSNELATDMRMDQERRGSHEGGRVPTLRGDGCYVGAV